MTRLALMLSTAALLSIAGACVAASGSDSVVDEAPAGDVQVIEKGLVEDGADDATPADDAEPDEGYVEDIAPADLRCEVRVSRGRGLVHIEAIAYGEPGMSGSYDATLMRSGRGGSGDTRQGGEFTIEASGETVLSETEFNSGRGDMFDAELTVRDALGAVVCEESAGD